MLELIINDLLDFFSYIYVCIIDIIPIQLIKCLMEKEML